MPWVLYLYESFILFFYFVFSCAQCCAYPSSPIHKYRCCCFTRKLNRWQLHLLSLKKVMLCIFVNVWKNSPNVAFFLRFDLVFCDFEAVKTTLFVGCSTAGSLFRLQNFFSLSNYDMMLMFFFFMWQLVKRKLSPMNNRILALIFINNKDSKKLFWAWLFTWVKGLLLSDMLLGAHFLSFHSFSSSLPTCCQITFRWNNTDNDRSVQAVLKFLK